MYRLIGIVSLYFFMLCFNRPCCKGYHKLINYCHCVSLFLTMVATNTTHKKSKSPAAGDGITKNVIIFLLHNLPYNVLTRIPNTQQQEK